MISEGEFRENLQRLRDRITEACSFANRNVEDVQILPVTKNWPVDAIHYAQNAGFSRVGENRVQEALGKFDDVPDVKWDLIGHLQSNKAKLVAGAFSRVQTVDSFKLLTKLNDALLQANKEIGIFIQVNTGEDPAKSGIWEEECEELIEQALGFSNIRTEGLMTIAPYSPNDSSVARDAFSRLRLLRDRMVQQFNISLKELSMGMTSDLKEAVMEGSTMIRVGSALFGERTY